MYFRKSNLRKEVKKCIYLDRGLPQKMEQESMQRTMGKRHLRFG